MRTGRRSAKRGSLLHPLTLEESPPGSSVPSNSTIPYEDVSSYSQQQQEELNQRIAAKAQRTALDITKNKCKAKDTYKVIEIQQAQIEEKRKRSAKFPPANTSSSSQYHQPRVRSPPPPPPPQRQQVPSFHNPGEFSLDNPMLKWKHSDFPSNQRRPHCAHPSRPPPPRHSHGPTFSRSSASGPPPQPATTTSGGVRARLGPRAPRPPPLFSKSAPSPQPSSGIQHRLGQSKRPVKDRLGFQKFSAQTRLVPKTQPPPSPTRVPAKQRLGPMPTSSTTSAPSSPPPQVQARALC